MGELRTRQTRREVGQRGEELAAAELERLGMVVVARNWQCALGEIDIVAEELSAGRRTIVFCEVKCRTGLGFGDPLEAITYAKLRKLRQLAAEWMTSLDPNDVRRKGRIRLDAIGVVMLPRETPRLTHLRGIG
jgi:putative endonuclease